MVVRRAATWLGRHFEACFHAWFWINASILAAIVGRPALAAVGLVTVAPVLALYVASVRRRGTREPAAPPDETGRR